MRHTFFPTVIHLRCTPAQASEVKARGGGHWLRGLINANSRPPAAADNPPFDPDPAPVTPPCDTPAGKRITPRSRKSRRVTLDKRKRRRVKSRSSRVT